ncbi:hypothetical protein [Candidatus Magnetominusculus xianensis]|uniref:DUF1640 domain-containing protein n=1 Tax=Candidatus Magnetominusculus xianensis TaxID=1748249 RepID=A0ABR5SDJ6_9BACT|nr:hypothetical protein [Candidatus Magnetominusculus xianensis]KWT82991.1 hypothetical protein ASN18_2265 [Candidatus Magnetominusculus xianensis]MBF0402701.1 hypothetical protein [Nitrospirota bacterium]
MTGTIELYNVLKDTLGEAGAKTLVNTIEEVKEQVKKEAATKADLGLLEARLERKIESSKSELELKIESSKSDLELKIESVKQEIEKTRAEIEKTRSDTIKWVAAMLVAQSGIVAAFIRLFGIFGK